MFVSYCFVPFTLISVIKKNNNFGSLLNESRISSYVRFSHLNVFPPFTTAVPRATANTNGGRLFVGDDCREAL